MFEVNRPATATSTATARLSRRDVRCSAVHSIDPANAVASARIEFGRKLRGAAGSYGRGIGRRRSKSIRPTGRPTGRARWRSVGRLFCPSVLLSVCPSQSVALVLPAVIRPVSRTDRRAGMSDSCLAPLCLARSLAVDRIRSKMSRQISRIARHL